MIKHLFLYVQVQKKYLTKSRRRNRVRNFQAERANLAQLADSVIILEHNCWNYNNKVPAFVLPAIIVYNHSHCVKFTIIITESFTNWMTQLEY